MARLILWLVVLLMFVPIASAGKGNRHDWEDDRASGGESRKTDRDDPQANDRESGRKAQDREQRAERDDKPKSGKNQERVREPPPVPASTAEAMVPATEPIEAPPAAETPLALLATTTDSPPESFPEPAGPQASPPPTPAADSEPAPAETESVSSPSPTVPATENVPPSPPGPIANETEPAAAAPAADAVPALETTPAEAPANHESSEETVTLATAVDLPVRVVGSSGGSPPAPVERTWERVTALVNQTAPTSSTDTAGVYHTTAGPGSPWLIWALGAVFGLGAGAAALRGLAWRRGVGRAGSLALVPPGAASPAPLADLVARVKDVPFDAAACFDLGTLLLKQRVDGDGLRYLDRAFRLDPTLVLRFLKDEDYAPVRVQTSVQRLLWKMKREHDQKAWSGYA